MTVENTFLVPVYKPGNTERTNDNTPSADPHLKFTALKNKIYEFEFGVFTLVASGDPDLKIGINGSAAVAHIRFARVSHPGGTCTITIFTAFGTEVVNYGILQPDMIVMKGSVETGGDDSEIAVWWSQDTSHADAVTVLQGSSLDLHEMG